MTGRVVRALGALALAAALAGCGSTPLASGASLAVGACIDPPTTGTVVTDAKRKACDEPHGAEVFYSGQVTGFDALPTEDQARQFSFDTCVPAFKAYSGIDVVSDPSGTYDIGWFSPTAAGWTAGDRAFTCYVYRVDGATMTGSVKKG